jgi:hypothetical protein
MYIYRTAAIAAPNHIKLYNLIYMQIESITNEELERLRYPIGRYQAPLSFDERDITRWIGVLAGGPGWFDAVIENMDEAQLNVPYRPGGWNTNQVIHHVADSHMNAFIRFKLALTEEVPVVKPYQESLWANLPDVSAVPVNVSITLIHALHRRLTALLQTFSDQEWNRKFFHPELNKEIALWEIAAQYAWHTEHHFEQIRQLRLRMNW